MPLNEPCHLELRLLDPPEPCAACGHPAGEHRWHPSRREPPARALTPEQRIAIAEARAAALAEENAELRQDLDDARTQLERGVADTIPPTASCTLEDDELLRRALATWGHAQQMDMIVEELCELAVAVSHFQRGRPGAFLEVVEELADVGIMLDQGELMVGREAVRQVRAEKLERLRQRLDAHAVGAAVPVGPEGRVAYG